MRLGLGLEPKRQAVWRALLLAASAFLIFIGLAAQACSVDDSYLRNERPDGAGAPTDINLSFGVADVLGVDDVNQQIVLDFFVGLTWTDPRLADQAGCRFPVTDVWFPEIYILNSSQLTQKRRNAMNDLGVQEGGRVTWVNRYIGEVSSYHNLRRFPFDSQVFSIEISIPEASTTEIILTSTDDDTFLAERLNIEGWNFRSMTMTADNMFV
ncbi:MAG: hypothetical protein AAGF79_20350, partial [Pseudomonadota bacterium]